ncbi:outer membrane usher protein [Serratia plymuthica]|uniref:outer membrane usher protein n=2 Tax=Serratia plymuthica TaxID=82996 RepID=UPI00045669DE|nr:outer membrane usher protein [Serratia plymuthica]AHY06094.1 fimbrial assembly protein [Serratia plymuthica]KYG15833.1 Outer membrane usher protein PapC precursor [Serratia plymuthica]QPS89687.1 outer membrane usher protein [Serratia plymuthica]QQT82732.1 outer membrane usher protein [Serratia plymuthica]UJD98072.1 outer membrane usher protein [Serratia plymuthica]
MSTTPSYGCTGNIRPRILVVLISFTLAVQANCGVAADIEFNTDVLDVKDRANIDLGQFSRSNFIMPGDYMFTVHINKQILTDQPVVFYPPDDDAKGSEACITPQLVEQLGLKEAALQKLTWWHQNQCLDPRSLKGMEARGDLGAAALYLNIPQAYLEYTAENWDPPSRWDEGIPGLLFDYNLNGQTQRQQKQGTQNYNLSGNGTLGGNLGAWRLRADWQSRLDHQGGSGEPTRTSWDWSRYYAYRALPKLGAKLTVGENYLTTDIFSSFRFAGASLVSDDNMLPPNLRGYAPEVTGVARSNAKVIIRQQGRVLYETQVAAGPFRIQDINNAVSGQLDVRVEEQDGSVQEFQMDTASIPYLTRPGSVRYKVAAGRPADWEHHSNGPMFGTGEFSWGVSNGWSLYGGGVAGGDYNALALGVGRDLMMFGALSFDATQSRANLPQQGTLSGGSYRLSYSKRFDDYDSQVTFAGYRFSERNYMSMSEYLDARTYGTRSNSSKEMYTISFNQQFRDLGLSAYLKYSHQTYWDRPVNDNYNLTLARYFDFGRFRNISLSLTGYRNKYNGTNDDGMYLSLSLPWGSNGSLSYSGSYNRNDNTHQVGYYDRLNERDTYQVSAGTARSGATASGYYSHSGDLSQVNASASYQAGQYSSLGLSMQGGATATLKGAALHRSSMSGGTRMLLDTDGVPGIPIRGYSAPTLSNAFGKAVVVDVGSYYRNQFSIDLNALPENADVSQTVAQATLTEGAIGYRRFEVVSGEKAMAVVRLADGSAPPFGATVRNGKRQEVGIINDNGEVYLSGIKAGEAMSVSWGGVEQCGFTLPQTLSPSQLTNLLLPCGPVANGKALNTVEE